MPEHVDTNAVADLLSDFEREYEQLWGGKGAGFKEAGFEILSVRSVAALPATAVAGAATGEKFEKVGARPVVFDDANNPDDTAVYRVRWPAAGQELTGPALVSLPGCVVVIPPGATATTDALGQIHVKVN